MDMNFMGSFRCQVQRVHSCLNIRQCKTAVAPTTGRCTQKRSDSGMDDAYNFNTYYGTCFVPGAITEGSVAVFTEDSYVSHHRRSDNRIRNGEQGQPKQTLQ